MSVEREDYLCKRSTSVEVLCKCSKKNSRRPTDNDKVKLFEIFGAPPWKLMRTKSG